MIGCAQFILAYDWTFEYLRRTYGEDAVRRYWQECISLDSQQHGRELIIGGGFDGMEQYWGHTLKEEEAGYTVTRTAGAFRIDMHACPSQGLLRERGQACYHDYCEHCMGWIEPVLREAGFVVHHAHNHNCQCYWEIVGAEDVPPLSAPGQLADKHDIRLRDGWDTGEVHVWIASVPAP